MADGVVILYGRGGNLGNFKIFADSLKKELSAKYAATDIAIKNVERKKDFFDFLKAPGLAFKIKELHIFSHSIGAGLFLSYGDPAVALWRETVYQTAVSAGRNVTYSEVVEGEIGAVLTDDLVKPSVKADQPAMIANFASGGSIKIWGCNAAVTGWVYSDGDAGVVDPADASEDYYWRALNEQNIPKPSIAQAFADFFQLPVHGATSGANIQVFHNKKWVSSQKYKDQHGKWPPGTLPHRLHPEKGVYKEFQPTP
jgi:hypothetical protein